MESEYPGNSKKPKPEKAADKKIDPVVTSGAVKRKKPVGTQFRETFFGGDAKGTVRYVLMDVLVPAAKDAFVDAGSQGIERLIFGEVRGKRPGVGPTAPGHIAYNRITSAVARQADRAPMQQQERAVSRRARAQHDFDEIVLSTRAEAETVIERLFDLIDRYESASVADLYQLVGLESSHTDQKWGWTDMRGAGAVRIRNSGYLLNLPDVETLG